MNNGCPKMIEKASIKTISGRASENENMARKLRHGNTENI
jgi:hypothetical protein